MSKEESYLKRVNRENWKFERCRKTDHSDLKSANLFYSNCNSKEFANVSAREYRELEWCQHVRQLFPQLWSRVGVTNRDWKCIDTESFSDLGAETGT